MKCTNQISKQKVQGGCDQVLVKEQRICKGTHLPLMLSEFKSQRRYQNWIEICYLINLLFCFKRVLFGASCFHLSSKPFNSKVNLQLTNLLLWIPESHGLVGLWTSCTIYNTFLSQSRIEVSYKRACILIFIFNESSWVEGFGRTTC